MKNNSSIILDKLIKTSLLEQTGLVHDPINKTKTTTNSSDTSWYEWFIPKTAGDYAFWGILLVALAGKLTHWGLARRFKIINKQQLGTGTQQIMGAVEKKWTTMDTLAWLRLYRGLSSQVNVDRFAAWVRANRTRKVNIKSDKFGNLTEVAERFSTKLDPLDAKKIWEANREKLQKAGMLSMNSPLPARGIKDLTIPRDMTFKQGDQILKFLNSGELIREVRRLGFRQAYKGFKRGDISAAEFIKELPKATAEKHASGLRAMEQQGLGGIPPITINVNTPGGPTTPPVPSRPAPAKPKPAGKTPAKPTTPRSRKPKP